MNASLRSFFTGAALAASLALASPPAPPKPATPPSAGTAVNVVPGAADNEGRRPISGRRTMAPDGEVRISNLAGRVEIVAWDRSEVEVKGSIGAEVERLEFGGGDNYTVIRVVLPSGRHSCRDECDAELVINVPRVARIDVDTTSADVSVADAAGPVRVNSVSGDVNLRTRSRDLDASSVSGEVGVVGNGADGRITAHSVSGDVVIEGVSAELQLESVSGDVRLQRSKITRLTMKSTSGDLKFSGGISGSGSFEFQTVSGDVDLDFEGPRDATFDVSTFSGDISNSFGPKARRTSEYAPGQELRFTEGKGAARVRANTLSGEVNISAR